MYQANIDQRNFKTMEGDQSWTVETEFAGGNASGILISQGDPGEIRFTPHPHGTSPLWFWFRAVFRPNTGAGTDSAGKLRLILENYSTLAGARTPIECAPVFKPAGQWWMRMPAGKPGQTDDGRPYAEWTINRSVEATEVALAFPYTSTDFDQFLTRARGYWKVAQIGLSSGGHPIQRIANEYSAGTRFPVGLYLVARRRGSDVPAAWVLDGMLQKLAGAKNNPFVIWAIPLADPDAALVGAWHSMPDLTDDCRIVSTRHENQVIRQDMERWHAGCRPVLTVNLQAAPLHETGGIYCELPDAQHRPEQHAQALKWAHVVRDKLGREFAAPDFTTTAPPEQFPEWTTATTQVCALTICVPWAFANGKSFSLKKYREAGRYIAEALIEKRR